MTVEESVHGKVTVYKCGTPIGGRVYTWAYFYKLDQLLFDSGCPNSAREILEKIKGVDYIFLTHHHEDHIGAAALLSETVKVYAPPKSIKILANPPDIPEYRKMVWGQPQPFKALPVPMELEVNGFKIEVIETPGHSFDHVTYVIGGTAFVGDLVNPPKQIVALKGENFMETIKSLENILSYNIEWIYGGTGIYSRGDVEEYLNYLKMLREKVDQLYNQGFTVEEIATKLFPNPPRTALLFEEVSGGEWSRVNMVKGLLGKPELYDT